MIAFSHVRYVIDAIACSRVLRKIKSLAMLWPPIISLIPGLLDNYYHRELLLPYVSHIVS